MTQNVESVKFCIAYNEVLVSPITVLLQSQGAMACNVALCDIFPC